jgi:hypothetical protein
MKFPEAIAAAADSTEAASLTAAVVKRVNRVLRDLHLCL